MRATALLISLLLGTVGGQETTAAPARVLPLNHLRTLPEGQTPGFHKMATAIGDDHFDGTSPLSRLQRHFATAHRAGVKYLRCAFSWNAIEKRQGEYDWKFWDGLVDLAEKNRIHLIPYVAYTPEWAARDTKDFWKQAPREPSVYADFMYTIAARYRGRILSWEIWNEPDNKDFWLGTVDEYAGLVELTARRIREADPEAVLVLGGMAYGPGKFFETLMTRYHIDRYVDVIAMHAYPETWMTESAETVFQEWAPAMARMIADAKSSDQLWINEMGYADYRLMANRASVYGVPVFYAYEHTRQDQAEMLFRFYVMAASTQEVALAGWYRIDDFPRSEKRLGSDYVNFHLGLLDSRGQPKPALWALAFFNRLFARPVRVINTPIFRRTDSQSVVNMFARQDGLVVITAWLRSSRQDEVKETSGMVSDRRVEDVSLTLPCSGFKSVRYFDVEGRPIAQPARIARGNVENIRLRGGHVFIAEAACSVPGTSSDRTRR